MDTSFVMEQDLLLGVRDVSEVSKLVNRLDSDVCRHGWKGHHLDSIPSPKLPSLPPAAYQLVEYVLRKGGKQGSLRVDTSSTGHDERSGNNSGNKGGSSGSSGSSGSRGSYRGSDRGGGRSVGAGGGSSSSNRAKRSVSGVGAGTGSTG